MNSERFGPAVAAHTSHSEAQAMLMRIQHETKLSYTLPVSETVFEVRMAPPSDEDQTSLSYRLKITPQAQVTSYRDGFGNRVDLFNVPGTYRELVVSATSFVRTHRRPTPDRLAGVPTLQTPADEGPVSVEAMEYLQPSPLVPRGAALDRFVAGLTTTPGSLAGTLRSVMSAVAARLRYEKGVTQARTTASEALELGVGVCQDFSHLMIGACRGLGLPARYVSGYVMHPGEIATHAWCQVWGGASVGWVDVDPTRSEFVCDEHVTTAVGRDYGDVPPNRGLWKGRAEESMNVAVTIEPVDRVPLEWNEWNLPAFRPMGGGGQSQSQRQGLISPRPSRPTRSAYPNQRSAGASLVQQQGEQQQQQQQHLSQKLTDIIPGKAWG